MYLTEMGYIWWEGKGYSIVDEFISNFWECNKGLGRKQYEHTTNTINVSKGK